MTLQYSTTRARENDYSRTSSLHQIVCFIMIFSRDLKRLVLAGPRCRLDDVSHCANDI